MIISDFTLPEIQHFRDNCNFVNLEIDIFEGRVKGQSLERLAEDLNISYDYARQISRKVNKKILKVI